MATKSKPAAAKPKDKADSKESKKPESKDAASKEVKGKKPEAKPEKDKAAETKEGKPIYQAPKKSGRPAPRQHSSFDDDVSTDQIDSWLTALGDAGVEIVDGAGGPRRAAGDDAPKALDIEKEEKDGDGPAGPPDEDEEYAYSRTSDPVRMYLRKMGSV